MLSDIRFPTDPYRQKITALYRQDETQCIEELIAQAQMPADALTRIADTARTLVTEIRKERLNKGGIDAFLHEYDLSSEEGIALMCLAEALLRIPDSETAEKLIRDKISEQDWEARLGKSQSLFVNASTWGLMITGKVMSSNPHIPKIKNALKSVLKRGGSTIVRKAMKILSRQFVMGKTIEGSVKRAKTNERQGYCYSYDMLGEAARTKQDAIEYFHAYQHAIEIVGKDAKDQGAINGPGISVKLSALSPRYELKQYDRVIEEVVPLFRELALQAKVANIGLTMDAEEADRLDISLDIFEKIFADPTLEGWDGFGLAIQTYQKRAPAVIDWISNLAKKHKRRIMVRLVKGAYWDSEIKESQMSGLESYPVFTRKENTDVSYLACAKKLFEAGDAIYPQFATHNAHSLAAVLEMAGDRRDFEFQCLHGMGNTLYDQVVGKDKLNFPCRIYAPVGDYEELLAYLVRRLLENGANTSFVNRLVDAESPIEDLIADPVEKVKAHARKPHPRIPLPKDIYPLGRINSSGIDLTNYDELQKLRDGLDIADKKTYAAPSTLLQDTSKEGTKTVNNPFDGSEVGTVTEMTEVQIAQALENAVAGQALWSTTPVNERATCLERAADLLEQHHAELMMLAIREAGKTIDDAIAEVREAVDFCRYYAQEARKLMGAPLKLVGPTGEDNELQSHPRGITLTISPWNFPLAIFLGQVVAGLATGNAVLAKPAATTPLIAAAAVRLLHQAGIPEHVLQLIPCRGSVAGAKLVTDPRVKSILFTGSTETGRMINQTLAKRPGPLATLIAETGGQNVMIVDSTALPEQVVEDVIRSAFGSAGQRCSALRVLYLQEEIADKLIEMLKGAMAELVVGDPSMLCTDIGPVIDAQSQKTLNAHKDRMRAEATLLFEVPLPKAAEQGTYVAPAAFEIDRIARLECEVFGPILHVIRYSAAKLDEVIADVNDTGYGLTLGIHSRIVETAEYIQQRVNVGNTYVNRNMIGAVVGVQPFGGEGLSGTGPKAGGPHYLPRLCVERTLTINTTATGGNATLLSLT